MQFQNLLYKTKEGKVRGPMSPLLFAEEMGKQLGFRVDGLVRVSFNNQEIWNVYEDGEGLTGFDHLAILQRWNNDAQIMLFIDTGVGGVPVAMRFKSDTAAKITPIYRKQTYAATLSDQEINDLINELFKDLSIFTPEAK